MRRIDALHLDSPFAGARRLCRLRHRTITQPNDVWAMDITYIPMAHGFVYLAAVMDWASRRVLSWRVSITLDSAFCIEAVEEAIGRYGRPMIFNTDQGSQPEFNWSSQHQWWKEPSGTDARPQLECAIRAPCAVAC